jgi:hypothetical protein
MSRSFEARFWSRVQFGTGCWLWLGRRDARTGAGVLRAGGERVEAHRVAWRLLRGPPPLGARLVHTCERPDCVRPDHLLTIVHALSARDAARRAQRALASASRHSARRPHSRFTPEDPCGTH